MLRKKSRVLLLCLAVLLMLPQREGRAAEEESMPASPEPAAVHGGESVADFYNVIMQSGADPWVYKHLPIRQWRHGEK